MYFDSSDYSNPLKININDGLEFNTVDGATKNINLKIRK